MTSGRDTALALSALPEAGARLMSAVPAWIWASDGSRILWANPAGGARLGAASFAELARRRWDERHPLRRSLSALGRTLSPSGTLARLRLTDDLLAQPAVCRCDYVRAGDMRGLLVSALEENGKTPLLAGLAGFFADAATGAIILDEHEGVLAESAPGIAEARTYATLYAAFNHADRALRLGFVDLGVPVATAAPERPNEHPPEPVAIEAARRDEPPKPQHTASTLAEHDDARSPDGAKRNPGTSSPAEPQRAARAPHAEKPAEPQSEPQSAPPHKPEERVVSAGRVPYALSRKPVRFLWQTDADDRYLFVSPGLAQVVGRNAEIVGERWPDAAARLRLDPEGRITLALAQHDTWSGLTAWWPVEGSNVRVPVELTALPVFGADHSFQGYRGFGILRPSEALMPATFETRFGATDEMPPPAQRPPYEEAADSGDANVVPIRADLEHMADSARLSPQERSAFEEIAEALRSRVVAPSQGEGHSEDQSETRPSESDALDSAPPPQMPEPPAPPLVARLPRKEERAPMHEETHAAAPALKQTVPEPTAREADFADVERRVREMTAILDTATDGVVILRADGMIESVNASAEALFGLEAKEMEGRRFVDLMTEESREPVLDYLSGLKGSGVASLFNEGREVAARAGAGSISLFLTMGRVSSEEDGRFCAVLRDITHWKRIESELTEAKRVAEEASKQKSEFLARVSHEIRTPLNAIIGFAEVMIEERFGPVDHERYREYLRDIRTSGEHVVSLVNDLLDISKIEAGRLDLNFAAVPLNDLVRECIGLMQPQANRSHVVLRSSLSREVPAIVADERTMRQIVLNLLSNSVRHTDPGGQVIASTSLSETGEAVLRVRDTGEGMSEDELLRALEPFRQLSTASLGEGAGLGLPLTQALVEANRATMSIKSAQGEGTVVTITIPPTRVLSE